MSEMGEGLSSPLWLSPSSLSEWLVVLLLEAVGGGEAALLEQALSVSSSRRSM